MLAGKPMSYDEALTLKEQIEQRYPMVEARPLALADSTTKQLLLYHTVLQQTLVIGNPQQLHLAKQVWQLDNEEQEGAAMAIKNQDRSFVTMTEASRILGVTPKTLNRWIHSGKLNAFYPYRNRAQIKLSDIHALQEDRKTTSFLQQTQTMGQDRLERIERQLQHIQQSLSQQLNVVQQAREQEVAYHASR